MHALLKIPAALSFLLLAAHFLHADQAELALLCLPLPLFLIMKRGWVIRILQCVLLGGALVWLWTMVSLAAVFQEIGRPSTRMIVILSCVAAFTALSAVLLQKTLNGMTAGSCAQE